MSSGMPPGYGEDPTLREKNAFEAVKRYAAQREIRKDEDWDGTKEENLRRSLCTTCSIERGDFNKALAHFDFTLGSTESADSLYEDIDPWQKFRVSGKPNHCPKCGSPKVVEIVYGSPNAYGQQQADQKQVILGGCCVTKDDAKWGCVECGVKLWKVKFSLPPGAVQCSD